MRRLRGRGADGFTLIEILVVVAVLGIIMVPLTAATVVGLRTSDRTFSVLVSSADRQFVTMRLTPDLDSWTSSDTTAGTATGCLGASPGTNVLRLQWREFDSSGTPPVTAVTIFSASYRVVGSGTDWQLVRYACTGGGVATTTVVARGLQNASAVTATVSGSKVSLTVIDALGAQYTVAGTRRSP